jgi:hypothetical protein
VQRAVVGALRLDGPAHLRVVVSAT